MRIKQSFLSLALLPLISFAAPAYQYEAEETFLASDRYYDDVPLACYAAFRAVVDLLPELTHQVNVEMETDLIIIDNVVTPVGYDTVFEFDVLKSPNPKGGAGHYTLAQTYTPGADSSTGTLYLNFTTKQPLKIDTVWSIFDKIIVGCAMNLPEKPDIPGLLK